MRKKRLLQYRTSKISTMMKKANSNGMLKAVVKRMKLQTMNRVKRSLRVKA
jgi:hypothetical protein